MHLRDVWRGPVLHKVAAGLGSGSQCCMVNSQGPQQLEGLTALVHERGRRDVLVALEARRRSPGCLDVLLRTLRALHVQQ